MSVLEYPPVGCDCLWIKLSSACWMGTEGYAANEEAIPLKEMQMCREVSVKQHVLCCLFV